MLLLRQRLSLFAAFLVVAGLTAGPIACSGAHRQPNTPRTRVVVAEPAAPLTAEAAFATVARVLRHPRCLNCHTVTDFPRVGDDGAPHRMNVRRGPDNHGPAGLQCSTCHQDRNQPEAGVPGAPHWGLAPLSMGWEGLDDRELAEVADGSRSSNGDRSLRGRAAPRRRKTPWCGGPGTRACGTRGAADGDHDAFVDAMQGLDRRWRDAAPPGRGRNVVLSTFCSREGPTRSLPSSDREP